LRNPCQRAEYYGEREYEQRGDDQENVRCLGWENALPEQYYASRQTQKNDRQYGDGKPSPYYEAYIDQLQPRNGVRNYRGIDKASSVIEWQSGDCRDEVGIGEKEHYGPA